jgi:hypothetical protein
LLIESEKIRQEFYSKVAGTLGRVKGIENALNGKLISVYFWFYNYKYLLKNSKSKS